MARRRVVTATFLEDAAIQDTEHGAALAMLFLGLILRADDYGIVQAHPGVIASQVFPYGQHGRSEVTKMLTVLEKARLLLPFVAANGSAYYALRTWFRHQHIARPEPLRVRPSDAVIDALADAVVDQERVRSAFSLVGQQRIADGRSSRAAYAADRRKRGSLEEDTGPAF